MKKKETWTEEYEHCGECPHAKERYIGADVCRSLKYKCIKTRRIIKDLWGEIPDFCPLETVEEK